MEIIYGILLLLSGLGVFMYGVHNISVGMESVANQQLRKSIHKLSKNPVRSFGSGLVATILVENSSVSTVLIVGMLNAGLISLYNALGMILGCNVGSTLILILFCFEAFKFVDVLALTVLIGAFIMLFAKSDKIQRIGKTIAGFGMLFLGLKVMSIAMGDIMAIPGANEFVASITDVGLLFAIGIFFGMTFHVLGTTALMISLINLPSAPFTLMSAIVIILGANIGSTISAILACLKSNIHSKRAALFNTTLNIFASLLMLLIIYVTPWVSWLESIFAAPSFVIVFTIIALNLLGAIVVMPLLKPIEKALTHILKDKTTRGQKQEQVFQITESEFRNVVVVKHQILKGVNIILKSISDIFKRLQKSLNGTQENINYKTLQKNIDNTRQHIQDTINNILRVNGSIDEVTYDRLNCYNNSMLETENLLQVAERLLIVNRSMNEQQQSLLKSELNIIDDICETINKLFAGIMKIYESELTEQPFDQTQGDILLDVEDEFSHQKTQAKKILLRSISNQKKRDNYDVLFEIFSQLDQACDHLTNLIIKSI